MSATDLELGARNEAVRDLQRRLTRVGFAASDDEPGSFGPATRRALLEFQEARGLRADGVCGHHTWTTLVEADRSFGERLLYLRTPMFRGDDVVELQRRLNTLGFDAGREDGILGSDTARALAAFQHDTGLTVDSICGPGTIEVMDRLGTPHGASIASVREREALRDPGSLDGLRVFVVVDGALAALGSAVDHALRDLGAHSIVEAGDHHDGALAAQSTVLGAEICVVLRTGEAAAAAISYFGTPRFRSETGFRVATCIQEEISSWLSPVECAARTYPILRETPMAAVLVELDASPDRMADVVASTGALARGIAEGVRRAIEEPGNLEDSEPL